MPDPGDASRGLQIAKMWAELPAEHLEVSLKALEPELQRDHEYRTLLARNEERHRARLERQLEKRRAHVRYLCGLWAGFTIAVGMLGAAVFMGLHQQPWLAALLSGPSLLALAKLFVIRKSDAADARSVLRSQRETLSASPQNVDGGGQVVV